MPALVAGIYVFLGALSAKKTWMAGTSPAMTPHKMVHYSRNALFKGSETSALFGTRRRVSGFIADHPPSWRKYIRSRRPTRHFRTRLCDGAGRIPCRFFFRFEFVQRQAFLSSGHRRDTVRSDPNVHSDRRFVPSSPHSSGSSSDYSVRIVLDRR